MPCRVCCCWRKRAADDEDDVKEERISPLGSEMDVVGDDNGAGGNPRNKCALAPGHSLMDWIRLGNSGKDLTGVGSRASKLIVTEEELRRHNTENDAWLAIRGNVYNITEYLSFHPGGVDEILRGAGIDATKLFEEIHPWVNYNQILAKCFIGKLQAPGISFTQVKPPHRDATFNWKQKQDSITFHFHTPAWANPYIEIEPIVDNYLNITIEMSGWTYNFIIVLRGGVIWPPSIRVAHETGLIDVEFRKSPNGVWPDFGTMEMNVQRKDVAEVKIAYELIDDEEETHDAKLFHLRRKDGVLHNIPIAWHVRIYKGDDSRSYSPIPCSIFESAQATQHSMCFLIKVYPHGLLSNYIFKRKHGDELMITAPYGAFNLKDIANFDQFVMIAGGTGITPMLSMIKFLLERLVKPAKKVTLIFFNKSDQDLLLFEELTAMTAIDSRFKVHHILSKPTSEWTGRKGRISVELVTDVMGKESHHIQETHLSLCGPDGFVRTAIDSINELSVSPKMVYVFPG